ncbi:hypothetical protein L6452_06367 [Arctium lappa]|uniref:Uncharacterized protein n=1 Tax=Arctium lappa TaxID=4217 RepID=A0ACB9EJE8_ARCLA|nr:hypothetical protein L6452_06367 [Arctium lappa]
MGLEPKEKKTDVVGRASSLIIDDQPKVIDIEKMKVYIRYTIPSSPVEGVSKATTTYSNKGKEKVTERGPNMISLNIKVPDDLIRMGVLDKGMFPYMNFFRIPHVRERYFDAIIGVDAHAVKLAFMTLLALHSNIDKVQQLLETSLKKVEVVEASKHAFKIKLDNALSKIEGKKERKVQELKSCLNEALSMVSTPEVEKKKAKFS